MMTDSSASQQHKDTQWEAERLNLPGLPPPHGCQINPEALTQLSQDEPGKRRRVYLEFEPTDLDFILADLTAAGFDMSTLRRPDCRSKRVSPLEPFSCLITGPAHAILTLLNDNVFVFKVSVDLPEYTWLSHYAP